MTSDAIVNDTGALDPVETSAVQHLVQQLPEETLVFLLGSRYCETDMMSQMAWDLFSKGPPGWSRVQAICDFVHQHIKFGYEFASPTKTAWRVQRTPGRLPRLRPPGDHVVPLHEHSRPLLHGLSG